ncbi:MAG TPA: hypothetical protein VF339_05365 [Gammaproteobacteria bacterium]
MDFFARLEQSGLGQWVSASIEGYPIMITLHSVGLAVVAGLAVAIDLRLLGYFRSIPLTSLRTFFTIAWLGFLVNFLSGAALFTSQATTYVTDLTFLLKMAFVLVGAATIGYLQPAVARIGDGYGADAVVPSGTRTAAVVSLAVWAGAVVTGRLIAYL